MDDSVDIEELDLSVRSWSVLKRNGVNTIAELKLIPPSTLSTFRHMSVRGLAEIESALNRWGVV